MRNQKGGSRFQVWVEGARHYKGGSVLGVEVLFLVLGSVLGVVQYNGTLLLGLPQQLQRSLLGLQKQHNRIYGQSHLVSNLVSNRPSNLVPNLVHSLNLIWCKIWFIVYYLIQCQIWLLIYYLIQCQIWFIVLI